MGSDLKTFVMSFVIGLVPVLLNCVFLWRKEKRETNGRLRYLVIRIATCLETFSMDSLHNYYEWNTRIYTSGCAGNPSATLLCFLPKYPEEVDWTVLDKGLLNRIISFPNRLEMSKRSIELSIEHDYYDEDKVNFEHLKQLYYTGNDAWELAKELRLQVGICSSEHDYFESGWGHVAELLKKMSASIEGSFNPSKQAS